MIYFVKDFYFPDFGGFGWIDGAQYVLPRYSHGIHAIRANVVWEEIAALHLAAYPLEEKQRHYVAIRQPKLVECAEDAPFKDRIVALGKFILPLNFFRRPNKYRPPIEGSRRYEPVEPWRVYVGNMDGDTSWWEGPVREDQLDEPVDFHEPIDDVFAALTPGLERQLWEDWQQHPPKQQILAQHWAAEVEARRRR